MFEKQSMLSFKGVNDFLCFYEGLNIYGHWRITDQKTNDRGEKVRSASYMNLLRNKFNEKHLFRRQVSISELISFVDSFYLMTIIFDKLKTMISDDLFNSIEIFCEYRINLSKNKRVDLLLVHKQKVVLIEFRISNTFPNMSSIWQKKTLELIVYKELLSYYIGNTYSIYNYAFIGMPEYTGSKGRDLVPKHYDYNRNNANHLADFLKTYLFT